MLRLKSTAQRSFGLLAAGLFAASLCAVAIDEADARRGGGGGRGGGGNHAHNFKRGGGGGGGGHHGNRHHHHGNDNWHRNYYNHGRYNYYGRWGAGAVAAGVTAAAIGSVVYSLPSGCGPVYSGGVRYYNCGSTWYQPQYYGSNVGYVAVPPR